MFTSPDEVAAYIRDNDVKFVDVRFCDLPGVMQHFTIPASTFGADTFADGLGFDGSSIRGFQAINESDMLLLPDAHSAHLDPSRAHKTLNINFFIHDPITREAYSRDPRNVAKKAEAYLASSGIADTAYFGPEAEFYIFDSIRHSTGINEGYYHIDSVEGSWNSGALTGENGGPNLGYKTRPKGGYFPVGPSEHQRARRWERVPRRPARDQLQVRHAAAVGRQPDAVQVHHQEHRLGRGQDRHLHAQAAVRRQRLRHALPPEPLEGRRAALPRRDRLRGPVRHRPPLHRWAPGARAVPAGLPHPDGQQLPPPGPGLRGADQPRLLGPQPLGLLPHPDLGRQPQGQAHRVPRARPVGQPLPRLLGDADGRPRRHQEQDRAPGAGRQGPLRAAARGGPGHREGAGLAGRRPRQPRDRPRVPGRRRGVHPRPDRDVDRVQAGERVRPDPSAPAPARVRDVLRHLSGTGL